ncbi:hypothetical protein OsccyDRAFT_0527 [Leptolyngbyaceae cyanobacterium JSC-12]|nr:hypothetical protein OsccyDRAFT_0527 [Leptolyngbyaceae cyanobacterium JSC-12]
MERSPLASEKLRNDYLQDGWSKSLSFLKRKQDHDIRIWLKHFNLSTKFTHLTNEVIVILLSYLFIILPK